MKKVTLLLLAITLCSMPAFAAAQDLNLDYTPLEPLPGFEGVQSGQGSFVDLISAVFKILITVGGFVAVVFLILGGVGYMISEAAAKKIQAKERVQAALWGIAILGASWIILNTINPQLVTFDENLLSPFQGAGGTSNTQGGGGGGGSVDTEMKSGKVATRSGPVYRAACRTARNCSLGLDGEYLTYYPATARDPATVKAKKEFEDRCGTGRVKTFNASLVDMPERNLMVCVRTN